MRVKRYLGFIKRSALKLITMPLVGSIVLIKPLIHFRFGNLRSERFGHFSSDVEVYLLIKEESPSLKCVDIIGCPEPVCNRQLQKMWGRTFRIAPFAWLWGRLEQELKKWTGGDHFSVPLLGHLYEYPLLFSTTPRLSFSEDEMRFGQELQQKLGIPLGAPWFCIHNRDSAYLEQFIGEQNWAYHDYRDFSPESMMLASEELVRLGYFAVRIGSHATEKLVTKNSHIIDYCFSSLRSDFLDIYLMAHCVAFLGSDSGISSGPLIFRKPCHIINFSLTLMNVLTHYNPWPFIPKHLFQKEEGRFLSLHEIFEAGLYKVSESQKFLDAGVEVISNTPEEIRDLALEADARIKGNWQEHPEDESLQDLFWEIFRRYASDKDLGNIKPCIGAAFLKQHQYLLH